MVTLCHRPYKWPHTIRHVATSGQPAFLPGLASRRNAIVWKGWSSSLCNGDVGQNYSSLLLLCLSSSLAGQYEQIDVTNHTPYTPKLSSVGSRPLLLSRALDVAEYANLTLSSGVLASCADGSSYRIAPGSTACCEGIHGTPADDAAARHDEAAAHDATPEHAATTGSSRRPAAAPYGSRAWRCEPYTLNLNYGKKLGLQVVSAAG